MSSYDERRRRNSISGGKQSTTEDPTSRVTTSNQSGKRWWVNVPKYSKETGNGTVGTQVNVAETMQLLLSKSNEAQYQKPFWMTVVQFGNSAFYNKIFRKIKEIHEFDSSIEYTRVDEMKKLSELRRLCNAYLDEHPGTRENEVGNNRKELVSEIAHEALILEMQLYNQELDRIGGVKDKVNREAAEKKIQEDRQRREEEERKRKEEEERRKKEEEERQRKEEEERKRKEEEERRKKEEEERQRREEEERKRKEEEERRKKEEEERLRKEEEARKRKEAEERIARKKANKSARNKKQRAAREKDNKRKEAKASRVKENRDKKELSSKELQLQETRAARRQARTEDHTRKVNTKKFEESVVARKAEASNPANLEGPPKTYEAEDLMDEKIAFKAMNKWVSEAPGRKRYRARVGRLRDAESLQDENVKNNVWARFKRTVNDTYGYEDAPQKLKSEYNKACQTVSKIKFSLESLKDRSASTLCSLYRKLKEDRTALVARHKATEKELMDRYEVSDSQLQRQYGHTLDRVSADSSSYDERCERHANLKNEHNVKFAELINKRDSELAELRARRDAELAALEKNYNEVENKFKAEEVALENELQEATENRDRIKNLMDENENTQRARTHRENHYQMLKKAGENKGFAKVEAIKELMQAPARPQPNVPMQENTLHTYEDIYQIDKDQNLDKYANLSNTKFAQRNLQRWENGPEMKKIRGQLARKATIEYRRILGKWSRRGHYYDDFLEDFVNFFARYCQHGSPIGSMVNGLIRIFYDYWTGKGADEEEQQKIFELVMDIVKIFNKKLSPQVIVDYIIWASKNGALRFRLSNNEFIRSGDIINQEYLNEFFRDSGFYQGHVGIVHMCRALDERYGEMVTNGRVSQEEASIYGLHIIMRELIYSQCKQYKYNISGNLMKNIWKEFKERFKSNLDIDWSMKTLLQKYESMVEESSDPNDEELFKFIEHCWDMLSEYWENTRSDGELIHFWALSEWVLAYTPMRSMVRYTVLKLSDAAKEQLNKKFMLLYEEIISHQDPKDVNELPELRKKCMRYSVMCASILGDEFPRKDIWGFPHAFPNSNDPLEYLFGHLEDYLCNIPPIFNRARARMIVEDFVTNCEHGIAEIRQCSPITFSSTCQIVRGNPLETLHSYTDGWRYKFGHSHTCDGPEESCALCAIDQLVKLDFREGTSHCIEKLESLIKDGYNEQVLYQLATLPDGARMYASSKITIHPEQAQQFIRFCKNQLKVKQAIDTRYAELRQEIIAGLIKFKASGTVPEFLKKPGSEELITEEEARENIKWVFRISADEIGGLDDEGASEAFKAQKELIRNVVFERRQ